MTEVILNPDGGPISINVASDNAHPGTYELRGWEADERDASFKAGPGNFDTAADDEFLLPGASGRDSLGRIISAVIALNVIPPPQAWRLRLEVIQDGQIIGQDELKGTSKQRKTLLALLQVRLSDGGGA